MLEITIPKSELFDNITNEFITNDKEVTIQLEHSLVSISKWESKWHKPFLSSTKKTQEEILDYIKCMTITQNVDPAIYYFIGQENLKKINEYIENPMTATVFYTFSKDNRKSKDVITSELIYYWMVSYNIPDTYQKWHLNRLLTLIRICNNKNSNDKMSKKDTMYSNRALNEARKMKLGTKG